MDDFISFMYKKENNLLMRWTKKNELGSFSLNLTKGEKNEIYKSCNEKNVKNYSWLVVLLPNVLIDLVRVE
ncbi:hypothetical protein C8D97_11484 [Pleionea mediterranea]|uniref:Uncharacterized protein n=1 Tax=Pleionea mediterranea TaxID=523701 RepID=A0A316FVH9_9GAMM|nr:hypothetical protein C8D97_11484 [Pleionea mediterranea]